MVIFLIYWIATTIYGVYWLVNNPSARAGDDLEYVTLLEIVAKIFPAAILAWFFVPIVLLMQIKFKRRK